MNNSDISKWLDSAKPKSDKFDKGSRNSIQGLHIRKSANGGVWRFQWRDITGKKRFEKIGLYPALTIEAARKAAQDLSAKLASGHNPIEHREKIREEKANTGQAYLDEVYTNVLATKKTGKRTQSYIENNFSSLLTKPMTELRARDIAKWQADMVKLGRTYATMKRNYGAFKTLLNDAVSKGYLEANPLDKVKLDKIHETQEQALARKEKRTVLTKEQMASLIGALDTYDQEQSGFDYVKPLVLTAFYTGFRPDDVYTLHWEHLSLNAFSPNIHKVIEKTAHLKPEPRTFPLSQELTEVLKQWHKKQGSPKKGLVFPHPKTGKKLTTMRYKWQKILEIAHLPKELQFYSLRHNFISQLVIQGHDLMSIAALAGHSDIQMIINHYGHLQPQNLQGIISQSFANILKPQAINEQEKAK